jgi:hypothetical protein
VHLEHERVAPPGLVARRVDEHAVGEEAVALPGDALVPAEL